MITKTRHSKAYGRIQVWLPALPAASAMRRAVFRPGNPVPELPSSDPDSAGAGQDGELQSGVGHDLGDLCALGQCGGAEGCWSQTEGRAGEVGGATPGRGTQFGKYNWLS